MKRLFILSALAVMSIRAASAESYTHNKPGTAANTTVAALKLAEAKAALSKASTKNFRGNLGTADGGRWFLYIRVFTVSCF